MLCALKRFLKIAAIVAACLLVLNVTLCLLPYPELAAYRSRAYGFAVLDRSGQTLRAFPAGDGVKREWVPLAEIPAGARRVFVRAEDSRFYLHCGVDPAAALAAALRNRQAGRTVSGASTITMQLARLVKPHRQGLAGKAQEAFDALRLEARLSKRQILELWLNGIPFGSNIEGLGAISRARFGRDASRLDDSRAALLAVIPRRPARYDPANNPAAAAAAAMELSARCRLNLNHAVLLAAAAEAAPETLASEKNPFRAPHFTERVAQAAQGGAGRGAVRTTLDIGVQEYAERRLAAEIARLEHNRVSNGAILAIDNASGGVLAYVGSASWFNDEASGKIDGVQVESQPGSCLKPFLYALAIDSGFSPNDILPDIPTVFGGGEAYSPANFNRRFNGPVRLRLALASSLNVPAVYLLERLGVRAFEDYLAELGFESIARSRGSNGVGLALGNAGVSLEELTRAFAAFPRGGQPLELRCIETPQPQPAARQPSTTGRQVMSPYSAWAITDILSDRASRFVGFGPAPTLATGFPAMFKTGTANQYQHIWALGATARFTVGVWMGNFSGETVVGRTGSSIPARLAADLLKALEADAAGAGGFPPAPADTGEAEICALSGMAVTAACTGSLRERLPPGKTPAPCNWHRGSGEPVYPPEYQSWLAERFYQGRTESSPDSAGAYIRLPAAGSVFYLEPGLPPESQAIRVETAGFAPGALAYADGVLHGSLNRAGVFALPLRRGAHTLRVEDAESPGAAETTIEVR